MKFHLFNSYFLSFMLSASSMWMESDAINIDDMVRLYRLEGDYNDDGSSSKHLSESGPIGFVTETPYGHVAGSSSRQVVHLSGIDAYASTDGGGLPSGAASRTMLGWFKDSGANPSGWDWKVPFAYGTAASQEAWNLVLVNGNINMDYWGVDENVADAMSYSTNTWYHVALSYDGTNIKIHVNGELKAQGNPDPDPNTSTSQFILNWYAIHSYNQDYHYHGYLSDVAVFNRALSIAELSAIYNAPEGLKSQANTVAGDKCLTGSSTPPSGLACDAATGTYKVANGGSCSTNSECASGLCDSNNICKVADGDTCSSNSDCTSAYCDTSTNVCATAPVLDPCAGNNCSGHGRCYATSVSSSRCHCENTFVEVMNGNKPSCACPSQTELEPDINRCVSTTSPPTKSPSKMPTTSPVTSKPTVSMTASPTASPSSTQNDDNCVDSSLALKITVNGELKNKFCTWVARKKTESRCAMETVSSHCPITCANYGGNCSIDSTARIKFTKEDGSSVMRYCTWIASKPNKRCEYDGAVETCRKTCKEFSARAV